MRPAAEACMSHIPGSEISGPDADPIFRVLLDSTPPAVTGDEARALLALHWGVEGAVKNLPCERDTTFRIRTDGPGYTLKFANPAEPAADTNLQTEALLWLERQAPDLRVPHVVAARDGRHEVPVTLPDGRTSVARLLSWVEGTPLAHVGAGPQTAAQIGDLAARLGLALRDFRHEAAAHEILWDIRHAARLLPLVEALPDTPLRERLQAELDRFETRVLPCLRGLRWQVVHNDMNHHNLLIDPADPGRVTGVLDFGDMVKTPLIVDVAVAASYLIHGAPDPVAPILRMVEAYHRVVPLRRSELVLLRDLIVARSVTSIVIGQTRARLYPKNADYILRNQAAALDGLARFAALPPGMVTEAFVRFLP
ncbi:aminotransferase [Sinirhodobacter populi]|uniref:Hydroxylysine kinase n=2 Tax=Paenirhodobacter populi TaxID=2306993 RepID=A0A443K677_9RHOB|nr:aminotransferase [Sinirhodobacter populi]